MSYYRRGTAIVLDDRSRASKSRSNVTQGRFTGPSLEINTGIGLLTQDLRVAGLHRIVKCFTPR